MGSTLPDGEGSISGTTGHLQEATLALRIVSALPGMERLGRIADHTLGAGDAWCSETKGSNWIRALGPHPEIQAANP